MEKHEFKILDSQYVGKYCLGNVCGLCVYLRKKPSFIKRFFMNHLLGWKWYNE